MESQCVFQWVHNSGADFGRHPKADYGSSADDAEKQALISQELLRYKMLSLHIRRSPTTHGKRNLRAYNISYDQSGQDYISVMVFIIVNPYDLIHVKDD